MLLNVTTTENSASGNFFLFVSLILQVKVYKGRKALAHALNDTKTAVKQLNKLVTVILIVVTILVWLLLMGIATTKVLVFLSSQLLVAAFMFGNTCKTIFEAIIFVFVMHPFDVGDRCVIDGVTVTYKEPFSFSSLSLQCISS
jgi:small-conductance mechanosensitive channel